MSEFSAKRYTITYILAALALAAVSMFVELSSGLSTILPCMVAALFEGQKIAEKTGQDIEKPTAWRIARITTGIVFVVNLVFFAVILATTDVSVLQSIPPVFLAVMFVVLMGVVFLANRFFLTLGIRSGLRAAEKTRK